MTTTDYSSYSLRDLVQISKERGLKGCSAIKKRELIELLSNTSATALPESDYVLQPMITYIGNKRKLVPWIMDIIEQLVNKFNINNVRIMDGFAGSGVVSRALMSISHQLYSNDIEYYSYILLRCFLETPTLQQQHELNTHYETMNSLCNNPHTVGFVSRLYSPNNTKNPLAGERCFYTRENARIIDTLLSYISEKVAPDIQHYLLGPLIIKASIHTNTAGVFRGFYKKNGIGHFGGVGENALERILAPITITKPIWSSYKCTAFCYNSDTNALIKSFDDMFFDIIYLDPPYNEHPYGSNYFMLNLIAKNEEPKDYSTVSGIPKTWIKSAYNSRLTALETMSGLISIAIKKSRFVLVSYNNEGLVSQEDWHTMLSNLHCHFKLHEKEYDTYHGSRNLSNRNKTVVELLYVISSYPL
jgi:adenine-specific DNA-methyltransferase